jgi:anion-transporting  ArsA/GET3 family ATPase
MIRLLLAPAKAGGRGVMKVFTAGLSVFTNVLTRIIGAQALKDLSLFVSSLETMFGGFRERAEQTYQLLKEPGTAFVVVAVPERDALREAAYFVERLAEERMPLALLALNRVHTSGAPQLSVERSLAAAEALDDNGDSPITAAVLRIHAERLGTAARDRHLAERFLSAHPGVPVVQVAAQPNDVHDLDGLRLIADELANGPEATAPVATTRRRRAG